MENEVVMEPKKAQIDIEKIRSSIQAGMPLSITTYTLPHEMEEYMGDVLAAYLTELNQPQMIQYLSYCLNELTTNAKKANTKRVYFKEKGLDISNVNDYNKGMENFKVDTLDDIKHYLRLQKQAGLYVKLTIQTRNGRIKIEVRNNAELTVFEYKRIHDKLSRAQQYTTVDQAMNEVLDDSEGAGLGLIILVLMLEKIGLTEENYQVLCENGETITRIILPLNIKTAESVHKLSNEFSVLIDELPKFPESINEITNAINNPNSKFSDIAKMISEDFSLSADLLKLVNSAAFGLSSSCRSILDATRLVGLRGIKNMLLSIGSMNTLPQKRTENMRELWKHSKKVAAYTYNLARNFCKNDRNVIDDSYVCGLLHDMGKVIFYTARPDFVEHMKSFCSEKDIEPVVLEKIMAGVNHGDIGALLAEKWNFPESISQAIRYHHEPDFASAEYRKLTGLVYLADMICHYQNREADFYQFDTDILAMFHIATPEQIDTISNTLKNLL